MPEQTQPSTTAWSILLVEDDKTIREQVVDYLSGMSFASRALKVSEIGDLSEALNLVRERKADLIILDVYRGKATQGGEQIGIRILDSIRSSGFVPVVLYTALPEGLEDHRGPFVRLVGKEAGGLERLKEEITDLFRLRIPQVHRAIVNHMDETMCAYMWGFVQEHWMDFEAFANKPEFLRLVLQRLALVFAREGITRTTEEVYGASSGGQTVSEDSVHPAEYYIKPPIGEDPMLGDVRSRQTAGDNEYLVVLWPTCDMVSTGGRTPKTELVLCARASLAKDTSEIVEWLASPSNTKRKRVERLISNTRDESPDRYHFLPGVWDIPDLIIDFQSLEHITLAKLKACPCLATMASPFAEALAARFQRYIGRIGTPDLDMRTVLAKIQNLGQPGA
jgi:CheY-like chemotaxis protein